MLMRVHRTENDHGLVRNIVYFQDAQGNIFKDSILLQYIINRKVCGDVESVVFEVPAHGNSDTVRGTPFHPLKKSTLAKIRKDVNTVGKVNSGAIYEASTSSTDNCDYGDLPRSRKQITDFASSARSRAHAASDNEVEMLLSYNSELEDDEIVFYHGDIPQDLWVIGTKRMFSELCQDSNGQPISVDATFNHGAFEVTPLIYRHQLIVAKSKNTPGKYVPATMIGPTIIQHDKKEETYDRALREIARKTNLRTTKIGIITDGEEALINACKANFNKANMLRCTNHFRQNCKDFLASIGITGGIAKQILDIVFGEKDLVEAEDNEDLKIRLKEAKSLVTALEQSALEVNEQHSSKFYNYLKESEKAVLRKMIRSVPRNAGMRVDSNNVPDCVYTNQSECVNSKLAARKASLGYSKKDNLSKINFIRNVWQPLVTMQDREIEKAIYGASSEYQVVDCALHLKVQTETWYQWSTNKRKKYVDTFQSLSLKDI